MLELLQTLMKPSKIEQGKDDNQILVSELLEFFKFERLVYIYIYRGLNIFSCRIHFAKFLLKKIPHNNNNNNLLHDEVPVAIYRYSNAYYRTKKKINHHLLYHQHHH
jgi:hypothetical protein